VIPGALDYNWDHFQEAHMSTEKKSKGKINPTVLIAVIGLVGTLITAILSSPVLITLIQKEEATAIPPTVMTADIPAGASAEPTESPTPQTQTLIFENTFENGNTSGFAFQRGEWQLGKDKNRAILKGIGPERNDQISAADFGNADFSDGIIEFQLKFKAFGGFILNYRASSTQLYTLYLNPLKNEIIVGYNSEAANWELEPFAGNSARAFSYELDTWYLIHLEAVGGQVALWVDDNRMLSTADSRLTTGGLNFVLQNGAEVYLDDVRVWELK